MKKTTLLICLIALFTSIQSFSQITSYPYSEDFESGDGGWTASGTGTWALGTPAATVINSAASGANSWATNLTGSYNNNEDSFVTSPIFDLSTLTAPSIEMSVWWESEFSWDGTVLQSSIDGGATWQNVGAFGDPNNWYTDTTINGAPGGQQEGWTGRNGSGSNGWVIARHALVGLGGQSSVQLRVAFGSDGSVQDEGFAFDDVSIFEVTCPEPLSLTATTTGDSTADITWSAGGSESEWQIWVQPAGTGLPTTDGVVTSTNDPYQATGLTPSTAYEVYVRANCNADGFSNWVGPVNFTTFNTPPPAPVGVTCSSGTSTFIFTEDFGNDTNYVPTGWTGTTFADSNGNWDITTPNGNSGGTGPNISWDGNAGTHLEYEASGDATAIASAITPAIDLSTAVDGAELSFYMHAFGADMGTLNIGVSTSATGPFTTEYTWIGDYQSTADEAWVPIGINLDAYLGQVIYIEFSYGGAGTGFEGDMSIDQVRVETCGNFCVAPTGLAVANVTDTTAEISWTANNGETAWEVVVQPAGTGMPTGSGTAITTNPYTATGLNSSTVYEVYVLADCGSGTSVWAGPINFTTLNTPPPPPVGVTCSSGGSTFVFTETFGTTSGAAPAGWTGTGFGGTNGNWRITNPNANSFGTGPNVSWDGNAGVHLEYEASGSATAIASAISPAIDLGPALDGAELSFWMHAFGADMGTLNVGVSTSPTGPFTTEYTWIGDYQTDATEAWVPIGVNLDAYLGQVIYVEFSYGGAGTGFEGDMSIDQIQVETCGTFCIAPNSITVDNLTATSADITWTPSGSETQWNYVVQPAGTGTPTSGTTVGTTTVSESGLTPQTDYEVYVQAICGADTSVWAEPVFFTTPVQTNFVLDCTNGEPQTLTYCYENNDINVFTFTSSDGTTPINLTFNAGQVEQNWDELVVLDSDGATDLNAATPYGNGGNLSGLTYQSTGSTISFQVQSDGSINCQGNGYTSITVTASCATCINPTATFVVVDDCANGDQFLVDVNITSLGDATSLSVQDNQGNPPVSVSTTGSITPLFGPYPFNTDIIFTVSNEQDGNCVITSQAISLAACPPDNDNPCNATIASVNSDESCTVVNPGTLLEATDSGYPNGSCTTSADDDVWYQFTAVGDQQIIQIQNVVGGFNVDHAVYEGTDCNNLTQLYCTTDDFSLTPALTIGNTYYIRVFSAGTAPTSITFDLCIQTLGVPTYCTDALPICPDLPDPFPNVSDGSTAPPYLDYGCLGSEPNPYWNTINVDLAGDYSFTLQQTSTTGNLIDIDFIVWGPFTSQDTGCYGLLPENIEDCSYSATATETVQITGAPAGSIYVILITNFNGSDGTYTFSQDSGSVNGINCDVVCDVTLDYDGIVVEQGTTAPDGQSDDINLCGYTSVTLTADTVYAVDSYDWYVDGIYQTGVNSPTFVATQSGSYQCIVGGGICADFTSSIIANINFFDDANANQAPDLEACDDGTGTAAFDLESQTATILGTQSATDFVVTYHETLSDAQSGVGAVASPYTATDGTVIYVRVEDVDAVGSMSGCASTNTNFSLVVNPTPQALDTPDQELCDDGTGGATFDLTTNEATTVGSQADVVATYYTSLQDAIDATGEITTPDSYYSTSETIYIRVENSTTGCFATTDFDLSVLPKPVLGMPEDLLGCDNNDDGIAEYDLTLNEGLLADGQVLTFSYYLNDIDATTSTNALSNVTNYESGATTIYVRAENAEGCFEVTTFDLFFGIQPETIFDTDVVYEVCPNATVPITVTATPDNYTADEVSIVWYDQNDNIIPGENSLDLDTVLTEGVYTIEVTFNDTGCSNTATVDVYELDSCIIPQGISPNNDGLNDNFDLSSFDVQRLEIYNRYGTLVYSKDTYSNEWHGQSNDGDELPVGTYYFVMKYQGTKQKAAWVYINR